MAFEALDLRELLRWEVRQQAESGHDVDGLTARVPSVDASTADTLFAELAALPTRADWPYEEPDDLTTIEAVDAFPAVASVPLDDAYASAVHAAWTGRIVGNMLGKPVEWGDAWTSIAIERFLRANDAWPLTDYFPAPDPLPSDPPFRENWPETTRGHVNGSSRDDDVDYTILNLHVLRRYGGSFTVIDVAEAWLTLLPFLQTYTAERVAVRNLVSGRRPPDTARYRNPYREWIGAGIRADVFGYVCPRDPAAAARLAYVDASLSHNCNGIYGEMWAAALVAAAFTASSAREALDVSLAVVPPRSRLREAIDGVCSSFDAGRSWADTRTRIEAELGHYSWIHTVNNAAVLTAGLLYGDGDFTSSIGLTVCGGWDTDSNAATAGSVAGILADEIPSHWTAPLHDHVRSAVFGYDGSSVTSLAAQTVEVASRMRSGTAPSPPRAELVSDDGW